MRLSDGEARGGGAHRVSILADAMEALIGAGRPYLLISVTRPDCAMPQPS